MINLVEECIARIREACGHQPIEWDAIRSASMSLDSEAQTKDQKTAIDQLKNAKDSRSVAIAASAVERAFLQGKPDIGGWPRRFDR
jgi:hypothetical protein